MREANRQLQMQLTMSIAKQRRVNEDLRKERERWVPVALSLGVKGAL